MDRRQVEEWTVRFRLVPVGCAGVIAGQLVAKTVTDLHAQRMRERYRRRQVKTVHGDPAAEQVPNDASVIRGRKLPAFQSGSTTIH